MISVAIFVIMGLCLQYKWTKSICAFVTGLLTNCTIYHTLEYSHNSPQRVSNSLLLQTPLLATVIWLPKVVHQVYVHVVLVGNQDSDCAVFFHSYLLV